MGIKTKNNKQLTTVTSKPKHPKLIPKIHNTENELKKASWIHNLLKGRTPAVNINGAKPILLDVLSSVLQGTVLGTILLTLLINIDGNISSNVLSFCQ